MQMTLTLTTIKIVERERLALSMPDVLQIGPFQLQGRLLALLLACALGLWLIRRITQRLLNDTQIVIAKPIEDLIFNSAIIVLFDLEARCHCDAAIPIVEQSVEAVYGFWVQHGDCIRCADCLYLHVLPNS